MSRRKAAQVPVGPRMVFLRGSGEGNFSAPAQISSIMRRHSRSIALASLFILLLTGLAYADDIVCGETLTRLIDDRGVEDDLTFTALQGEVVSVTVAAAAGQPFKFDPQWQITDSDGHKVPLANDDTRCGSTEHQCETLRFEASDTYTLSVRDDNHNAAGIYNVTLEAVSATANGALNGPPAQVPACARLNQSGKPDGTQLIERGQLVGGAIDAFGETDTFTFAAAAGDVVTIGLATGGSPARLLRSRLEALRSQWRDRRRRRPGNRLLHRQLRPRSAPRDRHLHHQGLRFRLRRCRRLHAAPAERRGHHDDHGHHHHGNAREHHHDVAAGGHGPDLRAGQDAPAAARSRSGGGARSGARRHPGSARSSARPRTRRAVPPPGRCSS